MEGDVNFLAVMNALKSVGYDNWVTVGIGPLYTYYTERLWYITSMGMDSIMS